MQPTPLLGGVASRSDNGVVSKEDQLAAKSARQGGFAGDSKITYRIKPGIKYAIQQTIMLFHLIQNCAREQRNYENLEI